MPGWREVSVAADLLRPVSRNAVASVPAANRTLSGGYSTIRNLEPWGGGWSTAGRAPASSRPVLLAGVASVVQSSVTAMPLEFSRTFSAHPSNRKMERPSLLWPVTMRRIG
jgi:hypothetical protein